MTGAAARAGTLRFSGTMTAGSQQHSSRGAYGGARTAAYRLAALRGRT